MRLAGTGAIPDRLMRRLRDVPRTHTSGRPGATVRRYYERLPRVGWTWTGRRRRNPPDHVGASVRSPAPEARSPRLKNAAGWRAARRRGSSFTLARWKWNANIYQGCASRRAASPHRSRGKRQIASGLRPARTRVFGCLTFESEKSGYASAAAACSQKNAPVPGQLGPMREVEEVFLIVD
jgi:hypothetical protein